MMHKHTKNNLSTFSVQMLNLENSTKKNMPRQKKVINIDKDGRNLVNIIMT